MANKLHIAWKVVDVLSESLKLDKWAVKNTVELLDNDNSVPFIARYRQEMTGNMGPEKLRQIKEQCEELRNVQSKAQTVYDTVKKQGNLTSGLVDALSVSMSIAEVEHLYAPYKGDSKRTLAQRAKELGLEVFAQSAIKGTLNEITTLRAINKSTKGLENLDAVRKGVMHILADYIAKNPEVLKSLRSLYVIHGELSQLVKSNITIASQKKKCATDKEEAEAKKFENYFDFSMPTNRIQAHQVLALNRAEQLKVLTVRVQVPDHVGRTLRHTATSRWAGVGLHSYCRALHADAAADAYSRLLEPLIVRQTRSRLTKLAETESISIFAKNLKMLLLTPPVRGKTVLGIDPGFRHGCKFAVTSPTGSILCTGKAFLHDKRHVSAEMRKLRDAVLKYRCDTIAIGNGTACRETEQLVSDLIQSGSLDGFNVHYCIVSENGASVYSASEIAAQELPDLDVTLRGAVSIARRLQDPLSELIKIEARHLGVGMYQVLWDGVSVYTGYCDITLQHDVAQKRLQAALDEVVEECVSFVGVDLNTGSEVLLRHVAGLNAARARQIVAWREKHGSFRRRDQLLEVRGIGPKSYEQCAGFLRVYHAQAADSPAEQPSGSQVVTGSKRKAPRASAASAKKKKTPDVNPLDATFIHPESLDATMSLLGEFDLQLQEIGSDKFRDKVQKVASKADMSSLSRSCGAGESTVRLILEALQQPLDHDYRDRFERPLFRACARSLADVTQGDLLRGRVTNATSFGVFVDVGVGRDGLLHRSAVPGGLAGAGLEVGARVEVRVSSLDLQRQRLGLSFVNLL